MKIGGNICNNFIDLPFKQGHVSSQSDEGKAKTHENEGKDAAMHGCFSNNLFNSGLTARVSCGGWEGGLAVETEQTQSQKHAEKTRCVPTVSCTLHAVLARVYLPLFYALKSLAPIIVV